MSELETTIYHAWLHQQLGIKDIRPDDFSGQQLHFHHRILLAIERPSEMVETAYQTYVNAVASQVAHDMDGTDINKYRQLTGQTYRANETRNYLETAGAVNDPKLWFNYQPYTVITSNISSDWTSAYNAIIPMGRLSHHQSIEDRQKALHDPDTGETLA